MVLICTSLMTKGVEHLFECLFAKYIFFGEDLFRSFAYFLLGCLFSYYSVENSLYILQPSLYQIYVFQTFSLSLWLVILFSYQCLSSGCADPSSLSWLFLPLLCSRQSCRGPLDAGLPTITSYHSGHIF